MFKIGIWLLAVLFIVFLGLQLARPNLPNAPATADLQAPPEVTRILRNSCYNCHSNETKLAWFDEIVPAYWLVVKDVEEARRHVNFSEIGKLPVAQQNGILFEAVNQIQFGAMPLPSYRYAHPGAAVTPEQLAILKAYLLQIVPQPTSGGEIRNPAAPEQSAISPAPNGIAFLPDYRNWKAVSSTDRFDNNTIRQILGNDTAIQAVATNHTNPWPDGTAFAKVAWTKQVDDRSIVRPGNFIQVEFMIRDSRKYAATRNWGFARWRGTDLKPYGSDASFVNECTGCHEPMRKNDYVYTTPVRPTPSDRLITSWIDPSDGTMSTLYANGTAVTWKQRPDDHWFGAKIATVPGRVESVSTTKDIHAAVMP
jgi:hypothetical protein